MRIIDGQTVPANHGGALVFRSGRADIKGMDRARQNLVILALVAMLLTVATPAFIARRMQLGSHARSPQEVTLHAGSTATIAGGRARLWFGCGDTGRQFEVSRAGTSKAFDPDFLEPCQAFGLTVELTKVEDGAIPAGTFRVTWKE